MKNNIGDLGTQLVGWLNMALTRTHCGRSFRSLSYTFMSMVFALLCLDAGTCSAAFNPCLVGHLTLEINRKRNIQACSASSTAVWKVCDPVRAGGEKVSPVFAPLVQLILNPQFSLKPRFSQRSC